MAPVPESHQDLVDKGRVGVLTTFGPDGFPQSTAVGFLFADGAFRISVSSEKQKVKNLRRVPEATLFLLDVTNTFRTVEVRGRAELIPDDDLTWAGKIAESHGVNVEDIQKVTPPNTQRICITIHPVKVNTFG
jgi:PPOX class probable F420-dependent enzyme